MLRRRVIPCLLVSDGGLVKTTRFGSPTYLGDPINAVRIFNEKEVPELVVLDIRATQEGRGPNLDLVGTWRQSALCHCVTEEALRQSIRLEPSWGSESRRYA